MDPVYGSDFPMYRRRNKIRAKRKGGKFKNRLRTDALGNNYPIASAMYSNRKFPLRSRDLYYLLLCGPFLTWTRLFSTLFINIAWAAVGLAVVPLYQANQAIDKVFYTTSVQNCRYALFKVRQALSPMRIWRSIVSRIDIMDKVPASQRILSSLHKEKVEAESELFRRRGWKTESKIITQKRDIPIWEVPPPKQVYKGVDKERILVAFDSWFKPWKIWKHYWQNLRGKDQSGVKPISIGEKIKMFVSSFPRFRLVWSFPRLLVKYLMKERSKIYFRNFCVGFVLYFHIWIWNQLLIFWKAKTKEYRFFAIWLPLVTAYIHTKRMALKLATRGLPFFHRTVTPRGILFSLGWMYLFYHGLEYATSIKNYPRTGLTKKFAPPYPEPATPFNDKLNEYKAKFEKSEEEENIRKKARKKPFQDEIKAIRKEIKQIPPVPGWQIIQPEIDEDLLREQEKVTSELNTVRQQLTDLVNEEFQLKYYPLSPAQQSKVDNMWKSFSELRSPEGKKKMERHMELGGSRFSTTLKPDNTNIFYTWDSSQEDPEEFNKWKAEVYPEQLRKVEFQRGEIQRKYEELSKNAQLIQEKIYKKRFATVTYPIDVNEEKRWELNLKKLELEYKQKVEIASKRYKKLAPPITEEKSIEEIRLEAVKAAEESAKKREERIAAHLRRVPEKIREKVKQNLEATQQYRNIYAKETKQQQQSHKDTIEKGKEKGRVFEERRTAAAAKVFERDVQLAKFEYEQKKALLEYFRNKNRTHGNSNST